MSAQKIVIAGASGFMGTYLAARFREQGDTVVTVGRSTVGRRAADVSWRDESALARAVSGASLVLNLAGKSVDCRYNRQNRAEILRSRVETTASLGRAIAAAPTPPELWINSSTATIYRHADDGPHTDENGEIGDGFSVGIATAWESEFFSHRRDGVRQVAIRTAIVLGDGSALTPLLALTRLGLGGAQLGGTSGRGRQMVSWIHIDDVWRGIRFLQQNPQIDGPVNFSSPGPVSNRELMRTLREATGAPIGIPTAEWMLRVGAVALRTEPELVLKSRWVLPTRMMREGFVFRFAALRPAIDDVLEAPGG